MMTKVCWDNETDILSFYFIIFRELVTNMMENRESGGSRHSTTATTNSLMSIIFVRLIFF
jgi:hypothetical protein